MTTKYASPLNLTVNHSRPSPLQFLDGRIATTPAQWRERRSELRTLFQHYMYGEMPGPVEVTKTIEFQDPNFLGGSATLEQSRMSGELGGREFSFAVLLAVPNLRAPVPVFASLNFQGNHTILDHPAIPIPTHWVNQTQVSEGNRPCEQGRGAERQNWDVEKTLREGFAFATICASDIEPDSPGVAGGIREVRPDLDWGAVAAWSWGLQRLVDLLVVDPRIDPKRIAAVGHSRNGKAAALASAFDERIELAIPLQAGCGGTAPSRCTSGETIAEINQAFPHWFNERFKQFNGCPERLPFDQGSLISLIAPRRVLFANAADDAWANPAGQLEVLRDAASAYRLLGVPCEDPAELPFGQIPGGHLGFFMRAGGHSMTPQDWAAFRTFAKGA